MEDFLNDVVKHVEGYYHSIVDITPKLILAIVIILISWFVATKARQFADKKLKHRIRDPLLATFIANLVKALLILAGILIMFRVIGLTGVAQSLLAGAGISAFIIGFALKDIGENFLAGILLAFKRPFSVGDIIESNDVKGKVVALNLRDTQIKSDSKNIYIPNALLIKSTLINFNSGGFLLQDFTIGLEYGVDYNKAIALVTSVLVDDVHVAERDFHNSAVVSGIAGAVIQLSIRYWVKTDALISDGKHRSEIIIKVCEVLKANGYIVK